MQFKSKNLRKLIKDLEAQGWRVEPSRSGWKCFSPDGVTVVTIHRTPSDHRAGKNILSELRKGGYSYE